MTDAFVPLRWIAETPLEHHSEASFAVSADMPGGSWLVNVASGDQLDR